MFKKLYLVLLLLGPLAPAQQIVPTRELLQGNLGATDDVEIASNGDLYLSFPQQGFVGKRVMTGNQVSWQPVASGLILAMILEPGGGALWTADFQSGQVERVDLASLQVTQTLCGFGFPIDLVFEDQHTLLVGGMSTPDNISGIGSVYRVDLNAPGGPHTSLLATGFMGALDVEVNAVGRIFVISFSSPTIDEVDRQTGAVTPLASGLLQPSDIIRGPGNSLYVCTLVAAEVLLFNPDLPASGFTQVGALIAETPGPGCEDMAADGAGGIVISVTNGSLWLVRAEGPLVQWGTALGGYPFQLKLDLPLQGGWNYQLVASLQVGAFPMLGTPFVLPIVLDGIFQESLNPASFLFQDFSGQLDGKGHAEGAVYLPPLPSGFSAPLYFGAVLWNAAGSPLQIQVPDFVRTTVFFP